MTAGKWEEKLYSVQVFLVLEWNQFDWIYRQSETKRFHALSSTNDLIFLVIRAERSSHLRCQWRRTKQGHRSLIRPQSPLKNPSFVTFCSKTRLPRVQEQLAVDPGHQETPIPPVGRNTIMWLTYVTLSKLLSHNAVNSVSRWFCLFRSILCLNHYFEALIVNKMLL